MKFGFEFNDNTELVQLTMVVKFSGLNILKEYCRVWQFFETSKMWDLIKWLSELRCRKRKGLKAKTELLQIHSPEMEMSIRTIWFYDLRQCFSIHKKFCFSWTFEMTNTRGQGILRAQNNINFHKKSLNWGQVNWITQGPQRNTLVSGIIKHHILAKCCLTGAETTMLGYEVNLTESYCKSKPQRWSTPAFLFWLRKRELGCSKLHSWLMAEIRYDLTSIEINAFFSLYQV